MRNELESAAAALGVAVDDDAWACLEQLVALWQRYGKAVNLVGAVTRDALAGHIGEAFATVACARQLVALDPSTRWIDVGSGGGFPGLVVAAITPCDLVLVEPRQKRASFLELALSTIGRKAVVSRARIERATWNENSTEREIPRWKNGFSIATSRAVFAPQEWLAIGDNLVMTGGAVLAHAHRGMHAVADRALRAFGRHGNRVRLDPLLAGSSTSAPLSRLM